ncbi:MAG: hypothetical protein WB445_05515 [Acinetobacter sp.]
MQGSASQHKTKQQFACAAPFWAALALPAAGNFAQACKNSSRRSVLRRRISAGAKQKWPVAKGLIIIITAIYFIDLPMSLLPSFHHLQLKARCPVEEIQTLISKAVHFVHGFCLYLSMQSSL